ISATERMGRDVSAARTSMPSLQRVGGHLQIHQVDADLRRGLARALVAIELAVVDLADAGVGDELEAVPARRGGGVELRAIDADAVFGGLQDGVGLGVDGRDAMAVFHHAAAVLAVRQSSYGAVVAGGEDRAVADDTGAH